MGSLWRRRDIFYLWWGDLEIDTKLDQLSIELPSRAYLSTRAGHRLRSFADGLSSADWITANLRRRFPGVGMEPGRLGKKRIASFTSKHFRKTWQNGPIQKTSNRTKFACRLSANFNDQWDISEANPIELHQSAPLPGDAISSVEPVRYLSNRLPNSRSREAAQPNARKPTRS